MRELPASVVRLTRLAAILGAVLLTAAVFAPAALLGDFLRSQTPLRLVHATGSLWHGSGFIAVSDGRRAYVVPGLLAWQVELSALVVGRFVLSLRHDTVDGTVRVVFDSRTVQIEAGEAQIPAALLVVIGTPFNTVRPGGTLRLRWNNVRIRNNGFEGNFQLDWENAQSALSRVAPLGTFRLVATGRGATGEATLRTLKGPLVLQGQGTMENGLIRFSGTAEAQPDMRSSLDALIGLLGKRVGDRALLEWEIQS